MIRRHAKTRTTAATTEPSAISPARPSHLCNRSRLWPKKYPNKLIVTDQASAPAAFAITNRVHGIPAVPADVGPGDLPNEGGLDVGAVSYTQGCYLGQEVMARLKSMGQVRRRLLRVAGEASEVPPLPAQLFTGERKIGELRSAVPDGAGGFVGLAMLSLLHLPLDGGLALAPGGTAVVQLRDRP